MTPQEELAWRLDCAAQGELGEFDSDHDNGWTARLLREASTFIATQAAELEAVRADRQDLANRRGEFVERLYAQERQIEALRKEAEQSSLRHRLLQTTHADAMKLWQALNDLSFECDAVFNTRPPSRETYNRTFAVMDDLRQSYSKAARENPAGCVIPSAG